MLYELKNGAFPDERRISIVATNIPVTDPARRRLMSLDALRGFDMFWITGGATIISALLALTGWSGFKYILDQLEHAEWNGFTPLDLVFPLFLFIAGVAMPYSLGRRMEEGQSRWQLHWRVIRRGLTLVVLGWVYQGLLKFEFSTMRYPSVLGRIGLAYMFAGLIFLHSKPRGRIAWVVGLLLGYWAAMKLIPVPGFGAGDLAPGHTLADFIDRNLLPGKLYRVVRDPEGIFSTVPAIGTALLGSLTGLWLRHAKANGHLKAVGMLVSGIVMLALGWFWNRWFPVNKNLWSSSFVLVTGGWSLILLSFFYWVIDVVSLRRWAFPFVVIGTNAITIYLGVRFIGFQDLAASLFARGQSIMHPAVFGCTGFFLEWIVLYLMYRNRWFLRV